MVVLFSNSGDPDQTPPSAASDLGLHCLLVTRLGISSLQWVKGSLVIARCGAFFMLSWFALIYWCHWYFLAS